MDYYYVNKKAQTNGDHEVHTSACSYLPATENQKLLGYFASCADAVKEQRKLILNLMDVIIAVERVIRAKDIFYLK